jgi:hypothetical protein
MRPMIYFEYDAAGSSDTFMHNRINLTTLGFVGQKFKVYYNSD